MKLVSILFLSAFFVTQSWCADKPTLHAIRTTSSPKIDGNLNDDCWQNIPFVNTTITYAPEFGKPPSERSEIKVLYDNTAIYIGAYLYDDHPDQIKHQLCQRDDPGALADDFIVGLDTY